MEAGNDNDKGNYCCPIYHV